jgi:hypothetical protein
MLERFLHVESTVPTYDVRSARASFVSAVLDGTKKRVQMA